MHSDFSLNRDPNRDKKLCGSTSNGTDQYQNGSSNLLTPYREQPRSTRNVVAYPRPAFSAKKRENYAPTSFDQQFQVAQGHTLYRKKKNRNTEVHTKIKMPNGWRTINSLVHKIRLHGRRGKGMAESFSRQKSRHAPQKEGGLKILCDLPPV